MRTLVAALLASLVSLAAHGQEDIHRQGLGGLLVGALFIAIGCGLLYLFLGGLMQLGRLLNRLAGRGEEDDYGPLMVMYGSQASFLVGFVTAANTSSKATMLEDLLLYSLITFVVLAWWANRRF